MAGPYAGQMRAGGDQVSNANKSYACAIQVHLTQLHTTQELQTLICDSGSAEVEFQQLWTVN